MNTVTPVKVKLVGTDDNVFALIGTASQAMKRAGFSDEAEEMSSKIFASANSYDEAFQIIMSYVEVY